MINILILSQKGGVAKTTLANEIAFSLDRSGTPYNFYDLDEQGGGAHGQIENEEARVTIVDTPGRITDEWPDWLKNADIVILPVRASMVEQPAFERAREIVDKYAPDVPHIIVLTNWNRFTTNTEFLSWLESIKSDRETILTIPTSEAILRAQSSGESVITFARKSSGARKMTEFVSAIRSAAGIEQE